MRLLIRASVLTNSLRSKRHRALWPYAPPERVRATPNDQAPVAPPRATPNDQAPVAPPARVRAPRVRSIPRGPIPPTESEGIPEHSNPPQADGQPGTWSGKCLSTPRWTVFPALGRQSPAWRRRAPLAGRLVAGLALLVCLTLAGPVTAAPPAREPLRVLVSGDAPFLVQLPDGSFDGISVRLWKELALQCEVTFTIIGQLPMDEAIERVEKGQADVLVGPVGITSARARRIAFSRPYYLAFQGIGSLRPGGPLAFMRGYLYVGGVIATVLISLIALVGCVLWLLERHRNPEHFPQAFVPGLMSGMWLAVVTITTVGYGDRVPNTRTGRFFMATWMLAGMIFASTLTASITSLFAEYRSHHFNLDRPSELAGRRITSVAGSTSANFARMWSHDLLLAPDLDTAMQFLDSGRVEAVVYHHPELDNWRHSHTNIPLRLASVQDSVSEYGFVFRKGSKLLPSIDLAILVLGENGEISRIRERWMADQNVDSQP